MEEQTHDVSQTLDRYHQAMQRVTEAAQRSGRRAQDVVMVAVTKTASLPQIAAIVRAGHRDLGESRVQQLVQRVPSLEQMLADGDETPPDQPPRWHMIGHLQRNKIKPVVPLVRLIHSLDTLRLAEELHNYGSITDRVIDVLLQVNVSGETTKHGVAPAAVLPLCEQIDTMMHLRVRGLMTMAPYGAPEDITRGVFGRCRELFEEVRHQAGLGDECNILSMGMSDDFELAIEEGANLVRVGRAIFGDSEAQ